MSIEMNRTAIVTGGSRGIGRAVVRRLAEQGYAVVVGYAGNADEAAAAVKEAEAAGAQAVAYRADVADETAVAGMFAEAESRFGGVDAVVNAAGRMTLARVEDIDLDEMDALHRTNIRGAFVVAREAARRVRPGGSITLFSTSVVGTAFPTYGAYAASKGAVEALTMVLAKEMRGRDVNVNTVAPGPTATELFLEGKSDELVTRLAKSNPLERLAEPRDIAEVAAFLATPAGHWVNGQVVRANGGMV
ncbi:SDR family oxidoreductase [Glycomyces algeriensis]|uniref:3-ketoacyl-ACP reductase n=1 Tax=Glycomyces algeriensis TaxID=256037 RepID=A0A9W6LH43_9ACTN|nr:SDR family oxidoreductase [Glycomyces algeriensis]MDA1364515.1 SDR family oxidoreductase [Glycomyces algeriensis]MDR7350550.1 3-oxoacyl-[acyl-carrier protein] reductase [Glycomyces algeriensis]GLI43258.1 3-ketoacyl-ACP reductase [Glycomyces algeriensis]